LIAISPRTKLSTTSTAGGCSTGVPRLAPSACFNCYAMPDSLRSTDTVLSPPRAPAITSRGAFTRLLDRSARRTQIVHSGAKPRETPVARSLRCCLSESRDGRWTTAGKGLTKEGVGCDEQDLAGAQDVRPPAFQEAVTQSASSVFQNSVDSKISRLFEVDQSLADLGRKHETKCVRQT
jgi:hypothetical protein